MTNCDFYDDGNQRLKQFFSKQTETMDLQASLVKCFCEFIPITIITINMIIKLLIITFTIMLLGIWLLPGSLAGSFSKPTMSFEQHWRGTGRSQPEELRYWYSGEVDGFFWHGCPFKLKSSINLNLKCVPHSHGRSLGSSSVHWEVATDTDILTQPSWCYVKTE